jgi:hypothetical protein
MKHIEDDLQMACVQWFNLQYPNVVMFHIPNGGKRDAREGARFKAMGVMPGVADLFVMKRKEEPSSFNPERYIHIWHGLFIELKSPKGKLTESQSDFAAASMANGYQYHICRSLDEFIKVVNEYLT